MPQTRFVLKKALAQGLKVVVVINKIDRPQARPVFVLDTTFDLFCDLNANDEQCEFPVVYASGVNGVSGLSVDAMAPDMGPLFEVIVSKVPPPVVDRNAPLVMLITSLDYDEHKGRIALGRVNTGSMNKGQAVRMGTPEDPLRNGKVNELFVYENFVARGGRGEWGGGEGEEEGGSLTGGRGGLGRVWIRPLIPRARAPLSSPLSPPDCPAQRTPVDRVEAGDICAVSGLEDVRIGETLLDTAGGVPLPSIKVEEPTVRMTFAVNTSPFAGREGKFVTSRNLRDRLARELERNLALRVEDGDTSDLFTVSGRGALHITILVETMRREGYEFAVGPPQVILKQDDGGARLEPYEFVTVEVADAYAGACVDMLSQRKGQMLEMGPAPGSGATVIKYRCPTRGLIGIRNAMLTASRGTAVLNTLFDSYDKARKRRRRWLERGRPCRKAAPPFSLSCLRASLPPPCPPPPCSGLATSRSATAAALWRSRRAR